MMENIHSNRWSTPSACVDQVGSRMFCSTVNSGTSRRSSGIYPTPCRARWCTGSARRSTWPSSVLPAPLRPIRPHISPSLTLSDASRMIGIEPIETSRFATLSIAGLLDRSFEADAADQLLHLWIRQRLGRCAVGDHGAVVKREYAIGETRNNLHVMLDEENCNFSTSQRRHCNFHKIEFFLDGNAAGRLIQKQQARPADHRHADIE